MADKTKAVYAAPQDAGAMGNRPTPDKLAAEARARDLHEADEAEKDTKRRNLAKYTASPTFRLSTEMPRRRAVPARYEKKQ